jgi:UDP-GlcNAc3NAcA epimerase
MKILTIIGARPQFIKAAPVSKCFVKHSVEEKILHTGQHFDQSMSDIFFNQLQIPTPYKNLEVNKGSHGSMTGRMLPLIEDEINQLKPDFVLLYGDTNTTLAGALAAAKLCVNVVHIESGLRSFNMKMPEEINRIITDKLSRILFCPTPTSVLNLRNEGITDGVHCIGDVMYDAALQMTEKAKAIPCITEELNLSEKGYYLATVHRAENTDNLVRLKRILTLLSELSSERKVVLPLHPRTENIIKQYNLSSYFKSIIVVPPLSYFDMINAERKAFAIITDSGGVQKEACFYQVPCITLRDETEWVETLEYGINNLFSPSNELKVEEVITSINHAPSEWPKLYGDGNASGKAVKHILEHN